jgi:predicted dehydrogenase
MIEAARKYGRILQIGHQGRSIHHRVRAIELLRQGAIGKLYLAKGICFKRRRSIGKEPNTDVPPGIDYNTWVGPAPMRPFNANRFHYNWHWFWDTGNGDIGNQGVHEVDFARWGLGKNTHPKRIYSTGGKFVYDDDQETPNTQIAVFEYDDCQLHFEVRGLNTGGEASIQWDGSNYIGNQFFGSAGYMSMDANGFQIYLGDKRELSQEMKASEPRIWDTTPHVLNFLAAVRSRKHSDLACDVETAHLSSALCHLANISYRTGRKLAFQPETETIEGDGEASRLLAREYRAPFVVPGQV